MFVAGCALIGALVAERAVELARRVPACSIFCNWRQHGVAYCLARAAPCPRGGGSVVVHILGTLLNRRTGDLLLCSQIFLAAQARFYLSALEHRCALNRAVDFSNSGHRNRGGTVVCATTTGERYTGSVFNFHWNAFSGSRLFQCLSLSLLFRR